MNVRFLMKIPFTVKTKKGDVLQEETKTATLSTDLLLDPYYVSESALLSMFVDESEYGKYGQKAREIAFNSSVRAWEWTKYKLMGYPEEFKKHYVRELALCLAMNGFAKHFYQGFQESLHRSKTYAEFTVTTTVKNSPLALRGILDQSQKCIDDIKEEIEEKEDLLAGLGRDNLKGACNTANPWTWRIWFNNNLPERSKEIYASEKVWFNGNIYKDGKGVSKSRTDFGGRAARSPIYHY